MGTNSLDAFNSAASSVNTTIPEDSVGLVTPELIAFDEPLHLSSGQVFASLRTVC